MASERTVFKKLFPQAMTDREMLQKLLNEPEHFLIKKKDEYSTEYLRQLPSRVRREFRKFKQKVKRNTDGI